MKYMNSARVSRCAHEGTRSFTTGNGFTSTVSRSLLTRRNSSTDLAARNLIRLNADAANWARWRKR